MFYNTALALTINIKKITLFGLCSLIFLACNKTPSSELEKEKVIAKINNSTLYISDINVISKNGLSSADSINYVKNYINSWASNEVFYQQSLNYLSDEELDVTKQLKKKKKQLLSYKFEEKLINEKLDTNVTMEQIEEYYNNNAQNFLLKNNIVKVLYVKTPINIPNLDKLKKLCYSTSPKDAEQLKSLCIQYANNYFMNDNTWLMYEDLKKEINQLNQVPEYNIQNGKSFEFTDATSFYFLKNIEVKSKNTLSPLNFEIKNIKTMLINQRKQKLIISIKKDFFEKAKTNKELEIYN